MSNRVIPKEQLTAYQRWELGSFASEEGQPPGAADQAEVPPGEDDQSIALPTAEELEAIHQQARDEGYQAGYAEGHGAGVEESQRLHHMLQSVTAELSQLQQSLAQAMLTLSVDLAAHIVRQTIRLHPDIVLNSVREALDTMGQSTQPFRILLNPADAELVRKALAEELPHATYVILEDADIHSGGCRIESGQGDIDATIQTAWRQALTALGRDGDWLE